MFVEHIRTPFCNYFLLKSLLISLPISLPLSLWTSLQHVHTCFATPNIVPHQIHITTHCKSKPAHHKAHHEAAQAGRRNLFNKQQQNKAPQMATVVVSFIAEPLAWPMSAAWRQECTNEETAPPKLKPCSRGGTRTLPS